MMRTAALAIALLMSGAAIAQTYETDTNVDADVSTQTDMTTDPGMTTQTDPMATTTPTQAPVTQAPMTTAMAPASAAVVAPGNDDPEHDARGIAVLSDPAVVPAGWNGITGTAVGGPLVDPATGETVTAVDDSHPPCTAEVTDNCLQTYERGRAD